MFRHPSIVAETLRQYSEIIAAPAGELENLLTMARTVEAACRTVVANLIRLEMVGSRTRGSSLRASDSLDVLVVASAGTWGSDSAAAIRDLVLRLAPILAVPTWADRLGAFAEVDGSAGAGLVLIPAFPVAEAAGIEVLAIPGGSSTWIHSTPSAHANYLARAQLRAGRGLADVVRLLRAWSLLREDASAIRTFPMELHLADAGACTPCAPLPVCLLEAFRTLQRAVGEGRTVRDPLGYCNDLELADPLRRPSLAQELDRARELAEDALVLEVRGDVAGAIRRWTRALGC